MSADPFPRERAAATMRRLPAYLKLAWRLARDPLLSRARRAAVVAAAGYLASPVDLVPGIIPVAGQLDDVAVALGALRFALAGLDAERRREHLDAVGLRDDDLAGDLRTVAATSAWVVRAGARATGRVAKAGGRAAMAGVRAAGKVASAGAGVTVSAVGGAAPAARAARSRATPAVRGAMSKGVAGARDSATRLAPAARDAAARVGPAAKDAASKGVGALRRLARRRAPADVTVQRPDLPALGPGASSVQREVDETR